jgi:hypothetical protein
MFKKYGIPSRRDADMSRIKDYCHSALAIRRFMHK